MRDLRLLIGDDEKVLLIGGADVQPGDGAGDAPLILGENGQHVLALHQVLGDVVLLDRAPLVVLADLGAVDVDDVDVVDGDPQLGRFELGGQVEGQPQVAGLIGLRHLVGLGLVPDPHGLAPTLGGAILGR